MLRVAVLVAIGVLLWPPRASGRAVLALLHQNGGGRVRDSFALRLLRGRWLRPRSSAPGGQAIEVLDSLAAALRAGLSVPAALAAVQHGPTGSPAVEAARHAVALGRSPAAALGRHARVSASAEWAMAARAWQVSERTGAPLAAGVAAAASAGRQWREHRRRVEAATAGARATMAVLTLLPLGGVGLAAVMGLSPTQVYGNPVAIVTATLGVAAIGLGRMVVRAMISQVDRGGG